VRLNIYLFIIRNTYKRIKNIECKVQQEDPNLLNYRQQLV